MREVLNALRENIGDFEDNSKVESEIEEMIDNADVKTEFNAVRDFSEKVRELEHGLEDGQGDGVQDGLQSIVSKLNRCAGQIGVCKRVLDAGAGRYKAIEYTDNASKWAEKSSDSIDKLVEYLTGEGPLSDDVLAENPESLKESAENAKREIKLLEETLNNIAERLER